MDALARALLPVTRQIRENPPKEKPGGPPPQLAALIAGRAPRRAVRRSAADVLGRAALPLTPDQARAMQCGRWKGGAADCNVCKRVGRQHVGLGLDMTCGLLQMLILTAEVLLLWRSSQGSTHQGSFQASIQNSVTSYPFLPGKIWHARQAWLATRQSDIGRCAGGGAACMHCCPNRTSSRYPNGIQHCRSRTQENFTYTRCRMYESGMFSPIRGVRHGCHDWNRPRCWSCMAQCGQARPMTGFLSR